jgi:hypothetical protein
LADPVILASLSAKPVIDLYSPGGVKEHLPSEVEAFQGLLVTSSV